MNSKPLVSGIIIFLNGEKFIEEAIQSVFAQTYDNWELLLVDDGSTDNSSIISQKYAQKYPEKVRYLQHDNHENRGMSASRNLGIRHSKGEYITFLDADDVWLPHKLERQVPILNAHPDAAMVYGRAEYWSSWTGNPEDAQRDCLTQTSIIFNRLISPPTQLITYLQDVEIYPCICSVLIRREIFKDVGGFEEEFRNANEDMVFHSKVFLKAPVYVANECWERYRMHPTSYWQSTKKQGQKDVYAAHLPYFYWLEKYLSEQKIDNPQVWDSLHQAKFLHQNPQLYNVLSIPKKMKNLVRKVGQILL